MRIPQLTLDMLMAVIALSQTKDYKKAGQVLGRTPSGVLKRITAANRMFSTRLFIKIGDNEELTPLGEVFYQRALRTVESALQTEETIAAFVDIQARRLHVGHSTHLPSRVLAMLHTLDLVHPHGIHTAHKSGLTADTMQDVLNGTLYAGFGRLLQLSEGQVAVFVDGSNGFRHDDSPYRLRWRSCRQIHLTCPHYLAVVVKAAG